MLIQGEGHTDLAKRDYDYYTSSTSHNGTRQIYLSLLAIPLFLTAIYCIYRGCREAKKKEGPKDSATRSIQASIPRNPLSSTIRSQPQTNRRRVQDNETYLPPPPPYEAPSEPSPAYIPSSDEPNCYSHQSNDREEIEIVFNEINDSYIEQSS